LRQNWHLSCSYESSLSFLFFFSLSLIAREFPVTFLATAKHIYKQLLRVFAHIYYAQFHHLVHLCCEGHFNSLFAHFIAFGTEFDLFQFSEFKGVEGSAAASGQGYPGACDLIEKWVELGILAPEVVK
jgi:MOB kinase activator 1